MMNTVLNNTTTLGRLFEMVEGDLFNQFVQTPVGISITFADNEPYKLQSELSIFEDGEDNDTYNSIQDVECEIYAILDSVYSVSELATLVYSISVVDGEIRVAFNILNTNTILGGIEMNNVSNTTNNNNELRGDVNMTTVNGVINGTVVATGDKLYNAAPEVNAFKNNNVVLIAKDIMNARHLYAGADRVGLLDISIEENKHGVFVSSKIVNVANNPLFKQYKATSQQVKTSWDNKVIDNYMEKFCQIRIKSNKSDKDFIKSASRKKFEFYIDTTLNLIFTKNKNGYTELYSNTQHTELTPNANLYKMLLFSAGDARVGRALFYKVDNKLESPKTILNAVAPGLYDAMAPLVSLKDGAKLASRFGLVKTSGKMDSYLENFIVAYDDVLDIVSGMSDGQVLEDARYTVAKDNLATEAEACKIAKQLRVGLSQKFTNVVVQHSLFVKKVKMVMDVIMANKHKVVVKDDVTKYYNAKNRLIAVVVGDLTKASHVFDANSTKAKVDYSKRINRGLTVMAVNHLSEGHLNSQINESVFVAAAIEDSRVTNFVMAKDNSFRLIVRKMDEVTTFYNRLLDKEMAKGVVDILAPESKAIALTDNYNLSKLQSVCPTNPVVVNSKYSSQMDTLKNAIEGLSFTTRFSDGMSSMYNMLLACDLAAMFGEVVIPDGCVFNAGVANMMEKHPELADKFAEAVITKAPKMGVFEYFKAKFLSYAEIDAIIDALNCDESLKTQLKFKYHNCPEGQVFFPSNEEVFKTLAGSDADGDKVQACFDEFICSLLNERVVLNIDTTPIAKKEEKIGSNLAQEIQNLLAKKNKTIEQLHFDTDGNLVGDMVSTEDGFVESMYMMNVMSQMSIGQITFWNNKVIAMLTETYYGRVEFVKYFLKECGISEGTKDIDLELDNSVINEKFALDLKAAMGQVKWTQSNLVQFLLYCNEIFRLYQEGAIDATKTGVYLNIIFKCDTVSIERLYPLATTIDNTKVAVIKEVDDTTNEVVKETSYKLNIKKIVRDYSNKNDVVYINKKEVKVLHFVDAMGHVENLLVNRVNNEFRLSIEKNMNIFKYEDGQVDDFITTMSIVDNKYPEVLRALYALKLSYNTVVQEKAIAADSEDYTDEVRDAFNKEIDNISNAVRATIDAIDFDAINESNPELFIAELLLGVGCSWSVNKVNPFASNKFAYTVCPEYAYGYFTGGVNYVAEARVFNKGHHEDGDTVMLSKGVSEFGMITDSRYTGEVVLTDNKVVAKGAFKADYVNESKAMIIFRETAEMRLTRNSSLIAGDDGSVYFCSDVTKNGDFATVGSMASKRVFTGELEAEYYVDDIYYISISLPVEGKKNQFADVQFAVAYLTK